MRLCAENGVETVVVPGPSAAVSALAVSGLPTARFSFEGFLSVKRTSRMEHLEAVRGDPRTLIFYEAPHKLVSTLTDMLEAFGDRRIALGAGTDEGARGGAAHHPGRRGRPTTPRIRRRGEFVLIVEGRAAQKNRASRFPGGCGADARAGRAGGLPVGGREGGRPAHGL